MNHVLTDVFQKLNLEPGTYHVHVNGYDVEIQVVKRKTGEPIVTAKYDEADVMLEPWVELPRPKPIGTVLAYPAPPRPPDIPEIPSEDELP
ncbi:MAG TPA: hypothetical protein VE999_11460 [Gemmataceae bacterium]|nr:hypothetical protein [Gemmataceae bacterium]